MEDQKVLSSRAAGWFVAIGVSLLVGATRVSAQDATGHDVDIREIETLWSDFWGHIARGDFEGARKYVHSDAGEQLRSHSPTRGIENRKIIAQFLLMCQPEPPIKLVAPDEIEFQVWCPRRGTEEEDRANPGPRLRREIDGKWKFPGF